MNAASVRIWFQNVQFVRYLAQRLVPSELLVACTPSSGVPSGEEDGGMGRWGGGGKECCCAVLGAKQCGKCGCVNLVRNSVVSSIKSLEVSQP
uniref:Uncharacterized protein n=1 Tax=Desertifilum tharense IPPAS B-1220 TaxID=1781255 RepID=A0A1E5QFX3_9CYAN|nr:hypothetical protein BH720_20945 [Desertifilum tharense IPPAS B-1220]